MNDIVVDVFFWDDPPAPKPIPTHTRNCPCDTCPQFEHCAATGADCATFRRWVATGQQQGNET